MKKISVFFSLLMLSGISNFSQAQQIDSIGDSQKDNIDISGPGKIVWIIRCSRCQQGSVELPRVLAPSPDAAALGKYGSIPVGFIPVYLK